MAFQGTDIIMLERGGTLFQDSITNLNTFISAGGISVVDNLLSSSATDALSANQGLVLKGLIDGIGDIVSAANIAARDAFTSADIGNRTIVHVLDDGDGKWARYQNTGTAAVPVWVKVSDEDALASGLVATALGYTPSPTTGTVTNTSGADATIPLVDGVNSGLISPAQNTQITTNQTNADASKVKTDFITVTQAVDLDAIETDAAASKVKTDFLTVTGAVDLDALATASHDPVTKTGAATVNPINVTGQALTFSISQLTAAP